MNRFAKHSGHPAFAGILAFSLVMGLGLFGATVERERHREQLHAETLTTASRVRADLEKALEQRIFMVEGLAGFAVADLVDSTDINHEAFVDYAEVLDADSGVPIRSLQLAPAGVVEHVYPIEGNEAAIGHDLLEDPDRRAAVMAAVELRRPMVAGPFELLQGGLAIVVRKPVFWPAGPSAGEFWGLATVVADVAPLMAEVGLDGSDRSLSGFDIALRGVDQSGPTGEAFLGSSEIFAGSAAPVLFEVTLPAGSWQLAMVPAGGWDATPWPREGTYIAAVLLLALSVGALMNRYAASRSEAGRSRDELATVFEAANSPIADVSADGTVRRWNREMAELTGVDASEAIGNSLFAPDLDPGANPRSPSVGALAELVQRALAEGQSEQPVEVDIEGAHGQVTPCLVNVAPKFDARGAVNGVVMVCQDISARLDAEQARAEGVALARTARLKDEFLANMSHELRTPLNGIIGLSSILGKQTFGPLNEKQSEYVRQVGASGKHLLSLINDVLDLAKIEAERVDLVEAEVDLGALIREAVGIMREQAKAKGLQCRIDLPDAPVIVHADARRMKQVVLNLMSNAVKFTPSGAELGVTLRSLDDGVELEVWDTGIGIPEDKQKLLFQPFQQVDASLDRAFEGSGLGLALTSKLVGLHGGDVRVSSKPGSGSRFTVDLPATRLVTRGPQAPESPSPVGSPSITRTEPLVLVAEDNEVNRGLLVDILVAQGLEVVTAMDGVEVVDRARSERPDVILMDIQMPHRDGLEATRMLKADPELQLIPIIAVTALAMAGDAERCLAAGCDAYVSKPIDADDIVRMVREFAVTPAI